MNNKNPDISEYEDMLALPHPISKSHPRMDITNRAAQFAPFAALTGFGGMITDREKDSEDKRSR
ncbi:MAG: hypothetical protein IJ857_06105 [Lachnospiraceae bacterium]|nr:hypothetical protein [Lachnospiraceae bacterium]